MVQHTDRDRVWNCAMTIALEALNIKGKHIKVEYISDELSNPPSDRTVRDVLNTMTDQGWLRKDTKHSHKWYPGNKLR